MYSISLDAYPEVAPLLVEEKNNFIRLEQQVQTLKDKLSQLFDKIEELENHINKEINKLQIQKISEIEGEY